MSRPADIYIQWSQDSAEVFLETYEAARALGLPFVARVIKLDAKTDAQRDQIRDWAVRTHRAHGLVIDI